MKVAVFTTSFPRHADDFAGRFVSDAVDRLRARGVEVEVVAPGTYHDFGLTFDGGGLVRNVRRKPWTAPFLFLTMVRALRRAARRADLVHAHWLAGGFVALFAGRPFVVTVHGSISGGWLDDFKLLRRAPGLARLVLNRARVVICVSDALADAARAVGVRNVVVIRNGVEIPARIGEEADPPEIFYSGRLSPEKGVEDLVEAAHGLNVVISGDGPLRAIVPSPLGFLPRDELERRFERAAVVVCPSRSEGFGVVCAEAMAHGKPVVASAVGGLVNLVEHEKTGLLVPPRDPSALRAALEKLLGDAELRRRYGEAGRLRIIELCSWERIIDATVAAYEAALAPEAGSVPERQPHAVLDPESRERKARKIEALLAPRCPLAGSRILDVGAGSGVIAARLAKRIGADGEVWAVDVVDQRVEREGYRFRTVSDTTLPFEDEHFDIVLSNHILDHVGGEAEQRRHLAEIHRVLAPGRCCYLAVANRWVVVEPHFRLPFLSWLPEALRTPYVKLARRGAAYDCNLPTRGELLALLRGSGFEYEDLTTDAMRLFADMETTTRLVGRLLTAPERLLLPLRPVIPTMVFLLRKTAAAP